MVKDKRKKNHLKFIIGIFISLVFLFLAFRKVNFIEMQEAFAKANYWYLLPTVIAIFIGHWLRVLRWRILLSPIRRVDQLSLFSSLMIGYMGNFILPARLGEFIRAFVLSRKHPVPTSTVLATIVMERIIDVFSLLLIMISVIFVIPLPVWVKQGGLITFAIVCGLFVFIILLKMYPQYAQKFLKKITKPFPDHVSQKIFGLYQGFIDGFVLLSRWYHYGIIIFFSLMIWICYASTFQFLIYAFDLDKLYDLPMIAPVVLLVITTLSIVIPSSPGFIGPYHYLCQLSLGLFNVAPTVSLTYAIVMHGIGYIPVLIVGFIFLLIEGIRFKGILENR